MDLFTPFRHALRGDAQASVLLMSNGLEQACGCDCLDQLLEWR